MLNIGTKMNKRLASMYVGGTTDNSQYAYDNV